MDNICFALDGNVCTILKEKETGCGTNECKFYKTIEQKKHIDEISRERLIKLGYIYEIN